MVAGNKEHDLSMGQAAKTHPLLDQVSRSQDQGPRPKLFCY